MNAAVAVPEDVARRTQDAGERWAQRVLDADLSPITEEKVAVTMVGAAILLNALAVAARMDESSVLKLVSDYRKRVLVRDRNGASLA